MHQDMARKLNGNRFCRGILAQMKRLCVEAGEYVQGPADLSSAGLKEFAVAQPQVFYGAESSSQFPETGLNPVDNCEPDMQKLSLEWGGWGW